MIKELVNGSHKITMNYPDSIFVGANRINWKKAVSKTITIERDGYIKSFEMVEYIEKPSKTAHDGKVHLKDKNTGDEFILWSRDLKQGDIAKLFKIPISI